MAITKNSWYTVKSGDTLTKIAQEAGIGDWRTIYNAPQNAEFRKKRPDPDKIYPGDEIWIPDPSRVRTSTGKRTVFVACRIIDATIIEIEADTDIPVSYSKSKVTKPHWKEGESIEDSYTVSGGVVVACSKRPAVFSLKDNTACLKVKLKIKRVSVPGKYKLEGTLEGLKFESTFMAEQEGDKDVIVKIERMTTSQRWCRGDMQWELYSVDNPSRKVSLSSTRLELFFILDRPKLIFQVKGVWTEVLRFLFGNVGIEGTTKSEEAAAKITEYIHSKHGLKYNTGEVNISKAGAPNFTTINWMLGIVERFKLTSYLNKTEGNIVNFYDQASAVQVLCGAIGIDIKWLFCKPFGYIKTTNLVGIGLCNNPFYPVTGSKKIVDQNDPSRTAFGNHAFCGIVVSKQDNVLDGCAGPHIGTDSCKMYLDKSIDRTMGFDGDVENIRIFKSVTNIE